MNRLNDAARQLKEDYQELLDRDRQRLQKEMELLFGSTYPKQQVHSPVFESQETEALQPLVDLVAPKLARLLNELDTYEINHSQFTLHYALENQLLSYQDEIDTKQKFNAVWDDGRWLALTGSITEEKSVQIIAMVSRTLEILTEAKRQKEKQQQLLEKPRQLQL